MGSVGNLIFTGKAGATPRASSPKFFQTIVRGLSRLVFQAMASASARSQENIRGTQEANLRHFGNLLGLLTAPAADANAQSLVAAELGRIAHLSTGDLASVFGSLQALHMHMQSLGFLDTAALLFGAMTQPGVRAEVLDRVPMALRQNAAAVLNQLMQAVQARDVELILQAPMTKLAAALAQRPVDGIGLGQTLDALVASMASLATAAYRENGQIFGIAQSHQLTIYLRELPDEQLRAFTQLPPGLSALPGMSEVNSDTLAAISTAVQHEGQARLDAFSADLAQRLVSASPVDDPQVLRACQVQVERLAAGSAYAVLLKALSLPEAESALSSARATAILAGLPHTQYMSLCHALDVWEDPAKGRAPLLLEQARAARYEAALVQQHTAFQHIESALARGDRRQAALVLNGYRAIMAELRQTGACVPGVLPAAICLRLKDEVGIAVDPEVTYVIVKLPDDIRGPLTVQLERPVPGMMPGTLPPATFTVTLPVEGVDQVFTVNETFIQDAVMRPNVTLSVSGKDADGIDVSTWHQSDLPASLEQRPQQVGRALDALQRIAGPMSEPLTRLLNHQLGTRIKDGHDQHGRELAFQTA
jgi:hypothetical protein